MKNLKELTIDEMEALKKELLAEIESRTKQIEPVRFILNTSEYFERYNGGWTKEITGINKNFTNGYSIEGKFMRKGDDWYYCSKIYVDCGIGGSRKNQVNNYSLFKVNNEGEIIIMMETTSKKNWATKFWDEIEKHFSESAN